MTYETPCRSPQNSPDDWFIGKDGRQYPEDQLVSSEQAVAHLDTVDPNGTRSAEIIERTRQTLEEEAARQGQIRRRQAKDACFVDCLVRTQCLDLALRRREKYGTWGGYYEEELRAIRNEIALRKRAKEVRD